MPRLTNFPAALAALGVGFHEVPKAEIDRDPGDAPPPIDFAPLRAAAHHAARWVLDTASTRTTDPDDLGAIKRVRRAVDATARGNVAVRASDRDLLTVAGVVLATLESEFQMTGLSHLAGALYASSGAPVLGRVLARLRPASSHDGVVRKVAVAEHRAMRIPIEVRHRPCLAHDANHTHDGDDDGDDTAGPIAFLTFR